MTSRLVVRRIALRKAAMPEVKRLVKKYGRSAVVNCIGKIREYEKSKDRLAALKREVAQLEKKI